MRTRLADLSTATWRKSSHSNQDGGDCVEISTDFPGLIPLRDSKTPTAPALILTPGAFAGLVAYAKSPDLSAATWRKSSHSNSDGGNCVEISTDFPGLIPLRDSKTPTAPALILTPGAFAGL
ncbi:DUF397 domain-containing protein, partial [Streptomyces sp. NPDC055078]